MRIRMRENVVEAIQYDGNNIEDVVDFVSGKEYTVDRIYRTVEIKRHLLNGHEVCVSPGQWVVRTKPFNSSLLAPIIEVKNDVQFRDRYESYEA
jgi:hypothetical protein